MYRYGVISFLSSAFFCVVSFKLNNRVAYNKKSFLQLNDNFQSDEYFQDLNVIHKFKNFLKVENYNDMINDLNENKFSKIFVDNNYKQIVAVEKSNLTPDDFYNHYHVVDINPIVLPNLVEKTSDLHLPLYFVNFASDSIINIQNFFGGVFTIASYAIPTLFLISVVSSLINMNSASNRMNIKNRAQSNNPFGMISNFNSEKDDLFIKPNISLASWAGSPEVVEECKEVISYIENKEKYNKIGADMPKGILLEGPPGTGKTLLAKAIASETNSTFISMAGSEFVELFVGMGAARVRELFDNARENTPCIIFIDEIDAVGRQRGAGINMANDEREQTLNQLLYEMDGFNNNEDIVIMAATNRKDVLDQALLRPGRFDRIIRVPLPDKQSREKILEFYFNKKNISKIYDISSIAELTDGFSGAQLKNLINEAAIISAKNNYTEVQGKYIFDAFEKSIVGLIKTNATIAPSTKLRVAIHESGHSLLAIKYSEYFDFQKASIQPTYNGAGGYTIFSEKPEIKDGGLYTKDLFKKRLIISMGGKAAEAVYYGNDFVSLGAIQDLKQANNLAKRMIGNFGMGDKLEVFFNEDIGDDSNPFLGRSLALGDKYSENTRLIMDQESLDLVKEAYFTAKNILEANKDKLLEFSELLQNNSVIYSREIKNKFIF
jgi:cell division protease FtsH